MTNIYKKPKPVTSLSNIVEAVCREFKVAESEITGNCVTSISTEARGVIVLLAKQKTNYSGFAIAKMLGWSNHGCAAYYKQQVDVRFSKTIMFMNRLERVIESIG